jgi:hypothetical protein
LFYAKHKEVIKTITRTQEADNGNIEREDRDGRGQNGNGVQNVNG